MADGSIMPEVPATHPNSVIFMIGERAADMIKKTWGSYWKPQLLFLDN